MKSTIAILISLYLIITTMLPVNLVNDLPKMQFLISHFKNHQLVPEQKVNFFQFLIMHYNPFSKHTAEGPHSDLPFYHSIIGGAVFILTEMMLQATVSKVFMQVHRSKLRQLHAIQLVKTAFKPPKF
ncbi:MAG: hypothetical protein ACNS62_21135 [Candidatus Cyclobacteriaceae bacterium M3_2C_046]